MALYILKSSHGIAERMYRVHSWRRFDRYDIIIITFIKINTYKYVFSY